MVQIRLYEVTDVVAECGSKSHSKSDLVKAQAEGERLWLVDTNCGDDDVVIGDLDQVLENLRCFYADQGYCISVD